MQVKKALDMGLKKGNLSFSVIIPTYNRADIVENAIKSVLKQSENYKLEIIVIDDCSTDNTKEVLKKYIDNSLIKYIYTQKNLGVTGAKNKGIENAQNDILIFLDSDDELMDGSLDFINSFFKKNIEIDILFGSIKNKSRKKPFINNEILDKIIKFKDYIKIANTGEFLPIIKREILEKTQEKYIEEVNGFEHILYTNLLKKGAKAYYSSKVLRLYDDIRGDRFSNTSSLIKQSERLVNGFYYYLKIFEDDLKKYAPNNFNELLSRLIVYFKFSNIENSEIKEFSRNNLNSLKNKVLYFIPKVILKTLFLAYRKVRY